MSLSSPIQWCDGTVNPVIGCQGCELWAPKPGPGRRRSCYAGYLHDRSGGTNVGFAAQFLHPTMRVGEMEKAARASSLVGLRRRDKPWLDGLPRLWFVSDMGDALSRGIDFRFLRAEIIDVAANPLGQRHQWQWLTKQPAQMAMFSRELRELGVKWPENLWAGTSITEPRYLERIEALARVGDDRTIRFLSIEPQHQPLTLRGRLESISWVVVGGESGPREQTRSLTNEQYEERKARPFDLDWARALRDECRRAKVPFFLKQLGSLPIQNGRTFRPKGLDSHGGNWEPWPEDLRVREMPIKPGRRLR